jgi:hypothetical protein
MVATDKKETKLNEASFTSYKDNAKDHCWYDSCDCDDVMVADCNALVEENNKGVGRFACMAESQKCYNPKFFSSFIKKLACQLNHYIENICALWDMVQCMGEYLATIGDMGTVQVNYARNSAVSSATFLYPITKEYDVSLYMDSTTGVDFDSDDKRRKLTDRKYRVYIRWCADGTTLKANEDNTMQFVVYHSGENYTDDMLKQRSVHWQMTGVTDGAMEMSDTLIIPEGQYLKVRVVPDNNASGVFRVHQFKVEYVPVVDGKDLPDCLKFTEQPKNDCECK